MDGARSLTEILDTLASWAGRQGARAGVLLVRGGQLRAWRLIGFDADLDDDSAFELPIEEAGIIADAVRTGEAAFAESGDDARVPSFTKLPPGHEMLAVPIPMAGQVVAVLYADRAADEAAREAQRESLIGWPASLELLARHATRCLERRGVQARSCDDRRTLGLRSPGARRERQRRRVGNAASR